MFEGHATYGGMSLKEVAMLIDGLRMVFDDNLPFYEITQVEYLVRELDKHGVPVVHPPGGLACTWTLASSCRTCRSYRPPGTPADTRRGPYRAPCTW